MRAIAGILVLVALGAPDLASAAPDGAPARIQTLGSWRTHDPSEPEPGAEPWTPADVAGFLALYPNALVDLGYRDGYPPGNGAWRQKGREVNALQASLIQEGIDGLGRICLTERPDILAKMPGGSCEAGQGGGGCDWEGDMDGEFGEAERVVKHSGVASGGTATSLAARGIAGDAPSWEHRLLVLRPGSASEERRRIVGGGAETLEVAPAWTLPPRVGERYEIRGSFDPGWVARVPRDAHTRTVRELWNGRRNACGSPSAPRACLPPAEPLDPFDPANQRAWPGSRDRLAITALATPLAVPALYGRVLDGGSAGSTWTDPYFSVQAVVMDVSDPQYRDWRIRYLMYKLRDHGLSPGEPACISLTYKPGWYTHYDEDVLGTSGDHCAVPGSGLWTGPAHVCRDGSAPGGPLVSKLYGPGEFEAAINSYIRELIARLAEHGWTDLRIMTVERPSFTAAKWSILDEDVRRHPVVIGEWMGAIEPALAQLRDRPRTGGVPANAPTEPGPLEQPAEPPAPAAPVTSPPALPPPAPPTTAPSAPTGSGSSAPTPIGSGGGGASEQSRGSFSIAPSRPRGQVTSSRGGGGGTVEPPSAGR